jgi:hypothetical protein
MAAEPVLDLLIRYNVKKEIIITKVFIKGWNQL